LSHAGTAPSIARAAIGQNKVEAAAVAAGIAVAAVEAGMAVVVEAAAATATASVTEADRGAGMLANSCMAAYI